MIKTNNPGIHGIISNDRALCLKDLFVPSLNVILNNKPVSLVLNCIYTVLEVFLNNKYTFRV
jgi:hypothetical protein